MEDEIYANGDYIKSVKPTPLKNQTVFSGPRSSERRFHGAVVLCLGLLSVFLLAGLIGLSVYYHVSAADLSAIKTNLTERLQASEDKLSSVSSERDLLNATLTNKTKELECQTNKQEKTCPAGWTMFSFACYLLSDGADSWDKGRDDCMNRGADLVIIDSVKEQKFLVEFTKEHTWIGLNDKVKEGTWKWIDGTPLTLSNWKKDQPDNGGGHASLGEEDCAHIIPETGWNDQPCGVSLWWICEKKA
ncbi:CD209 antigen-like protein C [Centropristis striata]|uniref:CD209 antigen-like protein C n=1 Tax=Centropristis striata TaxID=184440 RepID=UPI0027E079DB|nr:CD209 antigen-like protein C [Centropristis striata]